MFEPSNKITMSEEFNNEDKYFADKAQVLEAMIHELQQDYPTGSKLALVGLKQALREIGGMRTKKAHGNLNKD